GYGELLEVLGNPDHPEYEERLEWVGSIDPEEFDLDDINKKLLGID
ncbi:MAG: plasmid pRiA4b ORF-3 family protein, partial [Nostocaceae cyanobacterium]|nr:plasmid pRiA4b ORF-3 family protein [Nostocaceae cyanobacterium]